MENLTFDKVCETNIDQRGNDNSVLCSHYENVLGRNTRKRKNEQRCHGYTKTSTVYLIVFLVVVVAAIMSSGSGILVYLIAKESFGCTQNIPEKCIVSSDSPKRIATSSVMKTTTVAEDLTTSSTIIDKTKTTATFVEEITFTKASMTSQTEKPCASGWLRTTSSCYYLSKDAKNWTDAMKACNALKGQLVEIFDRTEDAFLRTKARSFYSTYWIGLTDSDKEGEWIWRGSNTKLTAGMYTHWSPRQPDNAANSENCATLEKQYSFIWNDEECYLKNKHMCLIDIL